VRPRGLSGAPKQRQILPPAGLVGSEQAAIGVAWSEGGLILPVGAGSDLSGSERPHIATLLAPGADANFTRRWDDRGFRGPASKTAPARMAGLAGKLPFPSGLAVLDAALPLWWIFLAKIIVLGLNGVNGMSDLDKLIDLARRRRMTAEERRQQSVSFVLGNTNVEGDKLSRRTVTVIIAPESAPEQK
jgi:hypothetical protein